MRKASVIRFAFLFVMAGQAVVVWGWQPSGVEIVPEYPTSCDVVVITLSGGWGNSCIPNASAISVEGDDIYFDVIWDYPPDIICADVITSWELTRSVGPLAPGTYNLYARLVGYPPIPEEYTPMTEFIVSDKQFVLSNKSLTIPEGDIASLTVALLMDPYETVEVTVSRQSGDTDITVESGGTLFFDSSNYSVPQTVTLAAAEDEDYLIGQAIIQVSAPQYSTAEVAATEGDNDIPSVLYVDADANGNNNGRSWADAFTNLQDALSIAEQYTEVEEIHVAQGIYRPAGPSGDRNATFQLINGLIMKGGYAGFGEPDPNARNVGSYKTILSGDLNGDDGPNFTNRGDNSFHVVVGNKEGLTSVLDGFTVTAGNGGSGGGVYNYKNCELTFTNCIFRNNFAAYGSGIYNSSGNMMLTNCMFINNSASEDGGGMHNYGHCNLTLFNCTFSNNTAEEGEYGNGSGGGMWNYPYYTNVNLTNCIFWDNRDTGGIDQSAQIHGGNLVINYCCIQGWTGVLGGSGNFGADPHFIAPSNGDYHLLPASPCIDAGDPNYVAGPNETDLDGLPRVIGGRIDMGVYEYYYNTPPVAVAGPNQVAYAWIDGLADVNLNGFGSYDDDNDVLDYYWSWTIDGNVYEANGIAPIIELPIGKHEIELVVDDGIDLSEPNHCTVTVIAPLRVRLFCIPRSLNRKTCYRGRLLALISMPPGIRKADINLTEPLIFYPGQIESQRQFAFEFGRCWHRRTCVWASFDKSECIGHLKPGFNRVNVVGKLTSGRYYDAAGYLRLVPAKWHH